MVIIAKIPLTHLSHQQEGHHDFKEGSNGMRSLNLLMAPNFPSFEIHLGSGAVMQESVPSADRDNPFSPRVGLVTAKTKQQLIPLNSHRWRSTSNRWSMKFHCAAPASISFSLMNDQPKTPQRNNRARNRETTMIYLLIKSRSHELSSKLHTRHRKSSLIALIINQEQSLRPSLDVASFLRGSNQCVSSSIHSQRWVSQIAIYISLLFTSFNTRLRALHTFLQTI